MEIEAKFSLTEATAYTRLLSAARLGCFALGETRCMTMHDTYLDTDDRAVMRAGYALRQRLLPDGVRMTLKSTTPSPGEVHRREEIECVLDTPLPLDALPGSLFRTRLVEIIGDAPAKTLCVIEQHRCLRMVNRDGIEIAEMALDAVTLHAGASDVPLLELEIELKGAGTEADLKAMIEALSAYDGLLPQAHSKLERALALLPPAPPEAVNFAAPDVPGITPADTMAEAARKILRYHLGVLLANTAGTFTGEDIEALHDMRVASRRIRSALKVFRVWIPDDIFRHARKGMRRIGRLLGEVRDLDVVRVHAESWLDARNLPADALAPLNTAWNAAYSQRRNALLAHMESDSYRRFLEQLIGNLDKSWRHRSRRVTVRKSAAALVQGRIDAVMTFADLGTSSDAPLTRYHALRREMKHLRYTLEFLREVLGSDGEQAILQLKAIQDHLGALQDAVVARTHLDSVLNRGTWFLPREVYTLWRPSQVDDDAVRAYFASRQADIDSRVETFPAAWEQFASAEFTTLIDSALKALNSGYIYSDKEMTMTDQAKPKYVILLGPPASGKGTQAARLRDELQLPHVSSGDLFRYNLKNDTELGKKAKFYMDKGELVPDDVTIAMVLDRLAREDCAKGALLDGFPRTIPQAVALDAALAEQGNKINQALNIIVPDEVLIARVTGRRLCKSCGASYHLLWKQPRVEGVCDECGGELYQRDDDTEATARNRVDVYWKQTSPLVDFYRGKGVCVDINGDQAIDAVTEDLKAAIASI